MKYFAYDGDISREHSEVWGGSLDFMGFKLMLKAPSKVVSKHCM